MAKVRKAKLEQLDFQTRQKKTSREGVEAFRILAKKKLMINWASNLQFAAQHEFFPSDSVTVSKMEELLMEWLKNFFFWEEFTFEEF